MFRSANSGNFGNVGKTFGDFNCSFTASAIGLNCEKFTARDLFRGTDLGTYSGGFWKEVDESSMLLLKLECSNEHEIDGPVSQTPAKALVPVDRGML